MTRGANMEDAYKEAGDAGGREICKIAMQKRKQRPNDDNEVLILEEF
jgi:hypothetical protein